MAHRFESGLFARTPAWHRLGVVLDTPPASVREALRIGKLDWRVVERPLTTTVTETVLGEDGIGERPVTLEVPTHKAIVRDSDNALLGVVGREYTPLQNSEAFAPFDPMLAAGALEIESAASLAGGRRVFMLGRFCDALTVEAVGGADTILPYLLISTGHDGGNAVRAKLTPIRVVCENTLTAAIQGAGEGFAIPHRANAKRALEAATAALVNARGEALALAQEWQTWARVPVTEKDVRQIARIAFDDDYRKGQEILAKMRSKADAAKTDKVQKLMADLESALASPTRTEEETLESYYNAPGADLAGRTAWGAYQAVTHRIDHVAANRGSDLAAVEKRLSSSWFGSGAQARARAATAIRELVAAS